MLFWIYQWGQGGVDLQTIHPSYRSFINLILVAVVDIVIILANYIHIYVCVHKYINLCEHFCQFF